MKRLALVGMLAGLVCGCPTTHTLVRSCAEAQSVPIGTACEGFTTCATSTCERTISCTAGAVHLDTPGFCQDVGSSDAASPDSARDDASHDVDAGPCAPRPPTSGTGCHTSAECDPTRFEMCFAPGASTGCGICVRPTQLCASDADCPSTAFCESYVDPCSHPGGCGAGSDLTSTRCTPRCTVDPASCGAGAQCGTDGRCRPIRCIEGYVCPSQTTCHDVAGGDSHGCARNSCAFDADCGCGGACLSGSCYDTLGACMSPAA